MQVFGFDDEDLKFCHWPKGLHLKSITVPKFGMISDHSNPFRLLF